VRARWLQLLAPALAVGLLLGGAGWQAQRLQNNAATQRQLDDLAERLERRLRDRMRGYEHGLRGLRGLVLGLGLDRLDLREFERYMRSRDLPREFPGMRGTGLVRRIAPENEADFVAATRAAGQPGFRVRQLREHDDERFVIQYVSPVDENRGAVGLDIGSEPIRRATALDAARSAEARLSAPIELVQAIGRSAMVLMLPIYADAVPPAGPERREAELRGWTFAPLVIDEVLQSLDLGDPRLQLSLYDAAQPVPFYRGGAIVDDSVAYRARDFAVFGRQWQLRLDAPRGYALALGLPDPRMVGAATSLITVLLAFLLLQAREARARREQLLAERNQRAALVDASSDAHLLLDAERRVLDWNPGAERLFGLPAAAARGRDAAELVVAAPEELTALFEQLLKQGQLSPQDRVARHRDGHAIDVSLVAAAMRDGEGVLQGFALTLRDIGGAKRLEREMRDLNLRLEQQVQQRTALLDRVGEMASVGGWQYEIADGSITWTAQTYRIHGVPADYQPTLEQAVVFYADEAKPLIRDAVQRALRDGTPWDLELPFRPRDGRELWVRAVGVPVHEQGRIVRLQGAFQDITEAKRLERELRRTGSLLQVVLDSASEVSIIATDADFVIRLFNRGAERLLGYAASELVGLQTPALLHLDEEMQARETELSAELARPLRLGEVFTAKPLLGQAYRWTYRRKDGKLVPVQLTGTEMRGDDGELLGFLGVAQDMSLQAAREQALRDATLKAEQASRAKGQFLANMSHEIRTPMNAVLGLAYLLAQTALDAEQARFVARIRSASQGLLGLLNDILDLSKIEAGELILEERPFDPRQLGEQVQELFAAQAQAKGLQLRLELQPPLPAGLRGDATRLRQVLTNLVSNAIKFTASGAVTLRLRGDALADGGWRLRLEVQDSGIGIAPEAQATVFRPFAQADASTTRRYGGTGLGLSISRDLVEAMGGTIGLHSEPGVGSCFWVELALDAATVEGRPTTGTSLMARLDGVRVLVADDSEINVEVASRILAQQGALVGTAGDGAAAVAAVQRQAFDIVLMDLQMPVLDGCAAAEAIRAQGLALPIVALTAGALVSERQRALGAGMNAFLSKPFQPAELLALVRSLVPAGDAAAASSAIAPDAAHWPELPGIATADASERLAGDFPLFARLLRQLLADAPNGAQLRDAAALHKLRGGAGNLGVRRLQELAGLAEAAARAGHADELDALQAPLQAALAELERAVAMLPSAATAATAATAQAAPEGDLQTLRAQLLANDLAALQAAETQAAALRERLGDADAARFQQLLAALRFAEAAQLLG